MTHVEWIDKNNIEVVRVNTRKYDSFLGDIIEKTTSVKPRLLLSEGVYYVRYKKSKKINWFRIFLHKVSNIYYLTPDEIVDDRVKRRLDNKYRKFNRSDIIKKIIK
jgi:hypothetical protein